MQGNVEKLTNSETGDRYGDIVRVSQIAHRIGEWRGDNFRNRVKRGVQVFEVREDTGNIGMGLVWMSNLEGKLRPIYLVPHSLRQQAPSEMKGEN